MSIPALPPEGSQNWYPWAEGLDLEVRDLSTAGVPQHTHDVSEIEGGTTDVTLYAVGGVVPPYPTGARVLHIWSAQQPPDPPANQDAIWYQTPSDFLAP